jgi:hypothetical protein
MMLNQPAYLPSAAAAGAGVRITISKVGLRGDPLDDGFFVKPHTETDFGMKLTSITRLSEPYASGCWNDWSKSPFQPLTYVNATSNWTVAIAQYSLSVRATKTIFVIIFLLEGEKESHESVKKEYVCMYLPLTWLFIMSS